MTDGYSISGSQAKSVALKPAGTFSGGNRFSVCGPVRAGSCAETATAARNTAAERRPRGMAAVPGGRWECNRSLVAKQQSAAGVQGETQSGSLTFRELRREH